MLDILPVRALKDNYIWLIRHEGHVAIVDPGDATPVIEYCSSHSLTPCAILITHHHWDHTNGIAELVTQYDVPVYGSAKDNIEGLSHELKEGDIVELHKLNASFSVIEVPGHTLGAICFVGHGVVFTGDTLFLAGCGRLFEGTPIQMRESLNKIKDLDESTLVYCGHEYTQSNLHFAATVEPDNADIKARITLVDKQLSDGLPTIPATIGIEKATNPFLRDTYEHVHNKVAGYCEKTLTSPAEVFTELRAWKDNF